MFERWNIYTVETLASDSSSFEIRGAIERWKNINLQAIIEFDQN
jgi:hypothetical protein